jgi:hypothetical protein
MAQRKVLAKILIVDDDIAVQAVVRLLLERDGDHVVGASNGLEGLSVFATVNFDLLIVDIFMPGWMARKPSGTFGDKDRAFRSSSSQAGPFRQTFVPDRTPSRRRSNSVRLADYKSHSRRLPSVRSSQIALKLPRE